MTKTELPLLVLGATGGQGGAVVDALLERHVTFAPWSGTRPRHPLAT